MRYEVTVPLRGTFGLQVEAENVEDARRFAEALAEHVMTTEGLYDESFDIAKGLGLSAELLEFDVSDLPSSYVAVEPVEG